MRKIFFIDDTVVNKISYYHLVCFLLALPFDFFYSEIILISFGLHTFIHVKKIDFKNILSSPVLILVSVYLLGLLAMVYSPDKAEAVNVATRQLAILIIPVLFAISSLNFEKYKTSLVCVFGFGCAVTIIYLYATALHTIISSGLPFSSLFSGQFMNHKFAAPVKLHATYLSMYTTFSLLAFLYLLLSHRSLQYRWLYITCAVILTAGMLQLSSRAVFISFLVIINFVFPFVIYTGKKRVTFFITSCIISAAAIAAIFSLDSFKERYISELKTDLSDTHETIENVEPRLTRWDAILELVKISPVIGYGSGSEKELLKQKYFEKKLFISYLNEFNAHNEYLSVTIKTGIVGLALLLYVLYCGFNKAIQKRETIFLIFMALISIVFISENVLDLNKGIFFYSFFFSLFFIDQSASGTSNCMDLTNKPGNRDLILNV